MKMTNYEYQTRYLCIDEHPEIDTLEKDVYSTDFDKCYALDADFLVFHRYVTGSPYGETCESIDVQVLYRTSTGTIILSSPSCSWFNRSPHKCPSKEWAKNLPYYWQWQGFGFVSKPVGFGETLEEALKDALSAIEAAGLIFTK